MREPNDPREIAADLREEADFMRVEAGSSDERAAMLEEMAKDLDAKPTMPDGAPRGYCKQCRNVGEMTNCRLCKGCCCTRCFNKAHEKCETAHWFDLTLARATA